MDDLTVLARVHELDRILEADDIEAARLVQVIDHRRERGGLAGAGGAGDQHHALVEIAQLGDDRRQRELLDRGDFRRNGAEGDRKSTRLNSSHLVISYAVFCLKKKKKKIKK